MRKPQARAAPYHDDFGLLLEQTLEVLGPERFERGDRPVDDGHIGQQQNATFVAHEIDVHVMRAVAGDGIERAARVLV